MRGVAQKVHRPARGRGAVSGGVFYPALYYAEVSAVFPVPPLGVRVGLSKICGDSGGKEKGRSRSGRRRPGRILDEYTA